LPASERLRHIGLPTDADLRLCAPKKCVGDQPVVRVARASRQRDPRVPPPGTQLIKRYKNEMLTVTVLEDGYQPRFTRRTMIPRSTATLTRIFVERNLETLRRAIRAGVLIAMGSD